MEEVTSPTRIIGIKGICSYCGVESKPTRDHFYPKMLGGRHTVWCCEDCNRYKGSLMPEQWIEKVSHSRRYTTFVKEKIIKTTRRLILSIPVEVSPSREVVAQQEIDLRKLLNIEKQKALKKPKPIVIKKNSLVECKCGIEKRTTQVNGYKMVRYWKDGNYIGSVNIYACMPCMFT